jgi:hypothetical protein
MFDTQVEEAIAILKADWGYNKLQSDARWAAAMNRGQKLLAGFERGVINTALTKY